MRTHRIQSSPLPALGRSTASALFAASIALGAAACTADDAAGQRPATARDRGALEEGDGIDGFCWKRTETRGAGTIPDRCPAGERDGALCYPRCADGFHGVGPVCWQACPAGYRDDGAFCRRDARILSADTSACPWYDACGVTLARGCSTCPVGYDNDGCTCRADADIFAKRSYGRTAGEPMQCAPGLERDAGLCYPPCDEGYDGVGPVCWGACPAEAPADCGAACGASPGVCAVHVTEMAKTTLDVALRIAAIAGAGGSFTGVEIPLTDELRAAVRALLVEGMKRASGGALPDAAYENIADVVITALVTGSDVDWGSLDPLGVAALVEAFDHPICGG